MKTIKNKRSIHKISMVILQILVPLFVTFAILPECTNKKIVVKQMLPVLEFPQAGIDDPAVYQEYTTRFYQDSKGNTVQVLIHKNNGRIINTWADAANESIAFTVRDTTGIPAVMQWRSPGAEVSSDGQTRFVQYTLSSETPAIDIGLFMLASMRVERDYQYSQRHLLPFGAEKYVEPELSKLIHNLEQLPENVRRIHLSLLNAENIEQLLLRLTPRITSNEKRQIQSLLITQPTFDGKNQLSLELRVDKTDSDIKISKEKISIRSHNGEGIHLTVKIGTDSPALTPLNRAQIFNKEFLQFYQRKKVEHDSLFNKTEMTSPKAIKNKRQFQFIHLDRQVKSLELLSSQEKLMAGMPNYATYFGRDMMMSALMLEPVCTPEIQEHVIASVLRKLSPSGEVSHEEALGGQAIRENAIKYNLLIAEYLQQKAKLEESKADSTRLKAEKLPGNLQTVVENYRMVDEDFQLPVLTARYLTNPGITADRKRAFLHANSGKDKPVTRLSLLMRNFQYIFRITRRYVERPDAKNLVSFKKLNEQHWISGSWRDSEAGYAKGCFAMDVNAIWVPKALEAVKKIFVVLKEIGFTYEKLESVAPEISDPLLSRYIKEPEILQQSIQKWSDAINHFEVHLSPQQFQSKIFSKLEWLPDEESRYWKKIYTENTGAPRDIEFLALSLDEKGKPIPVANTDFATLLFLEDFTQKILNGKVTPKEVINQLQMFTMPYPVGLFVEELGPLVANDYYASKKVWENFKHDHYHSPRVVWGREVNLLVLGLSKQILSAYDPHGNLKSPSLKPYVEELKNILSKVITAVESTGLKHNELWGYQIHDGKLFPKRYASTCDIQLWNVANLTVQFLLEHISEL